MRHSSMLLTRGAPAGKYSMPRGSGSCGSCSCTLQQPAFAAAPNKDHRAARAFALPAFALERGEAVGEGSGAGRCRAVVRWRRARCGTCRGARASGRAGTWPGGRICFVWLSWGERYRGAFAGVHSVVRGAANCMKWENCRRDAGKCAPPREISALIFHERRQQAAFSEVSVAPEKKRPRENAASLRRAMSHFIRCLLPPRAGSRRSIGRIAS